MTHCTVCGAEAREGAKFCTSCGARLEDVAAAETPADADSDLTATSTTVPAPSESASVPTNEVATYAAPGTETATEPEDADNAPTDEAEPLEEVAPVTGDPYVASWPSETQAETDTTTATTDMAVTATPEGATSDDGAVPADDADHHGASAWESWAPVASGESTILSEDDALHGIRELVDQLKHRVDRLAHPVSLHQRGVDPDDLAKDLKGWSTDTKDIDEILAALRSVRESPENVTALLRLASYADDLERIIGQYGEMTSAAERWVDRLRDQP